MRKAFCFIHKSLTGGHLRVSGCYYMDDSVAVVHRIQQTVKLTCKTFKPRTLGFLTVL